MNEIDVETWLKRMPKAPDITPKELAEFEDKISQIILQLKNNATTINP